MQLKYRVYDGNGKLILGGTANKDEITGKVETCREKHGKVWWVAWTK